MDDEIWLNFLDDDNDWDAPPSEQDIAEQDAAMLRRQQQFRKAAEAVAAAMGTLPEVQKVVLFGSVAKPLQREVPRFREYRRANIEVWHECSDVDIAVWISRLDRLRDLQKARSRALDELVERNGGVAHHQVDAFLMEPGTDRYLGRLCCYSKCPKGKPDCYRDGCGDTPFLEQHEDFAFNWASASDGSIVLYERDGQRDTP